MGKDRSCKVDVLVVVDLGFRKHGTGSQITKNCLLTYHSALSTQLFGQGFRDGTFPGSGPSVEIDD